MCKYLIFGILLLGPLTSPLYGQQKYEKESRLKEKEIPSSALDFIAALVDDERIKWYLEEGLDRTSMEAKFIRNSQKISVEFDSHGNLEDIEVQIKWVDLQKSLQDSIANNLSKDCDKFKIKKVQIQYSGEPSTLLSLMKGEVINDEYITRYEIVVKCNTSKDVNLFEYLFSNSGEKIAASKIVLKNYSNLEY